MAFDGSAIRAPVDGAVAAQGTVHGIAALMADRSGILLCQAAGDTSCSRDLVCGFSYPSRHLFSP